MKVYRSALSADGSQQMDESSSLWCPWGLWRQHTCCSVPRARGGSQQRLREGGSAEGVRAARPTSPRSVKVGDSAGSIFRCHLACVLCTCARCDEVKSPMWLGPFLCDSSQVFCRRAWLPVLSCHASLRACCQSWLRGTHLGALHARLCSGVASLGGRLSS